jgi:hypothetical protein
LKAVNVSTVLPTVSDVLLITSVSSVPTIHSYLVGSVMPLVLREQLPTDKLLFVFLATVRAEHVPIIQVRAPAVIQGRDFCK